MIKKTIVAIVIVVLILHFQSCKEQVNTTTEPNVNINAQTLNGVISNFKSPNNNQIIVVSHMHIDVTNHQQDEPSTF